LDYTISPDFTPLYDILVSTVMGLALVRAALKNSALGGILESTTQEHLISEIENQVQHALAPDGTLSTSIRVQMTNVLHQSNKTVREIFAGTEAGTSAAANDPRGSTQHADGRPPPMGGMSPVEARATDAASATHDGSFGISTGAVIRGVRNRRQQAERAAAGLSSEQEPEPEAADDTNSAAQSTPAGVPAP
jgi:hypothetical protein